MYTPSIFFLGMMSTLAIYYLIVSRGRRGVYAHLAYTVLNLSLMFFIINNCLLPAWPVFVSPRLRMLLNMLEPTVMSIGFVFFGYATFRIRQLFRPLIVFTLIALTLSLAGAGFILLNFDPQIPLILVRLWNTCYGATFLILTAFIIVRHKLYHTRQAVLVLCGFFWSCLSILGFAVFTISGHQAPSWYIFIIILPMLLIFGYALTDTLNLDKNIRKTLLETDKFATLGMLLGGVIHEIHNPLASISSLAENMEKKLPALPETVRPQYEKYIQMLTNNTNRVEKTIGHLKALFYKKEMSSQALPVEQLFLSVIEIFQNKIKNRIRIHAQVEEGLSITGNPDSVTHILINLVSNSIDAIADEGTIFLKAFSNNEGTHLVVSDSGQGMHQHDIPHIFKPFFTTKTFGHGNGLGLYIVHELISSLNWSVEVRSKVNEGTDFIIRTSLPGQAG